MPAAPRNAAYTKLFCEPARKSCMVPSPFSAIMATFQIYHGNLRCKRACLAFRPIRLSTFSVNLHSVKLRLSIKPCSDRVLDRSSSRCRYRYRYRRTYKYRYRYTDIQIQIHMQIQIQIQIQIQLQMQIQIYGNIYRY